MQKKSNGRGYLGVEWSERDRWMCCANASPICWGGTSRISFQSVALEISLASLAEQTGSEGLRKAHRTSSKCFLDPNKHEPFRVAKQVFFKKLLHMISATALLNSPAITQNAKTKWTAESRTRLRRRTPSRVLGAAPFIFHRPHSVENQSEKVQQTDQRKKIENS